MKNLVSHLVPLVALVLTSLASPSFAKAPLDQNRKSPTVAWQKTLLSHLKVIDSMNPEGVFGVYVKSLKTGREVSFRGDEDWYLASGIKIPVAMTVFQQIDEGLLKLTDKVEVLQTDYIDGAGELNYIKPGSKVSIRLLLDQSLTFSDNTATDLLIRTVGLDKINKLTSLYAPRSFHPITRLDEVRRQVYSTLHPQAKTLSNMDFIRLKVIKEEKDKLDYLARLLKVQATDFKLDGLDSAYEAYYATRLNSATLRGFGSLLENLNQGVILKEASRQRLMNLLFQIETGENRIKAGLPKTYHFAHKTGTQHKRFCDMGLLTNAKGAKDQLVVVACVRSLPQEQADKIFRQIGEAIHQSGVLRRKEK